MLDLIDTAPASLHILLATWLTLLGLCVGSFLNVVIARLPLGQSIVHPRSRCPKCGHTLSWYENVPLLSWLVLRGRCRGCAAPISARYPLIELLTGLLYLGALHRFDWTLELLSALTLITLLVPLTFIDLEHYLLPHALTLPGIVFGVLLALPRGLPQLVQAALGAAAGFGLFWLMEIVGERIFKKEALGGGDKYLLAMIGAFLGFRPLLAVIFLSSLQGSILGVTLLIVRGRAGPELPPRADGASTPAPETEASLSPETPSEPLEPEQTPGIELAPPVTPSPESESIAEQKAAEPADTVDEDDWVPSPNNLPFGPYLSLAALEILFFSEWLSRALPTPVGELFRVQW